MVELAFSYTWDMQTPYDLLRIWWQHLTGDIHRLNCYHHRAIGRTDGFLFEFLLYFFPAFFRIFVSTESTLWWENIIDDIRQCCLSTSSSFNRISMCWHWRGDYKSSVNIRILIIGNHKRDIWSYKYCNELHLNDDSKWT